jgi:hypothetical protein
LISIDQKQNFPQEYKALAHGLKLPKSSSLYKLTPFMDESGLLRIKGRLQCSDLTYEEKHPVIMACSHLSSLLIRFQHKLMKHSGVQTILVTLRNQYWIIGGRKLAKRVKRFCIQCQKQDAKACDRPFAPLPSLRVQKSPPFSVIGIDHTGVLYCADFPLKKFYVLLITCAVVRAVHLELVNSLNASDVCLALRRMFARRGLASVIYSDNAPSFKAAKRSLSGLLGPLAPKWEKIVPQAPWWGGWWERLNRPIKAALKKTLGHSVCTRTELETCLHEVEACVNSRPLTFVGDDITDDAPLTPAHFLIGRNPFLPARVENTQNNSTDLLNRKQVRDNTLDEFWSVWSNQYIKNLPPCSGTYATGNLKIDSVVMIHEDSTPRLNWKLGRVVKLHVGKDGEVRSIDMKTALGKTVTRPIQKVFVLETSEESVRGPFAGEQPQSSQTTPPLYPPTSCPSDTSKSDYHSKTKSGRLIRAPTKLNI